jgi:cytidylate kinase
MNDPTLDSRQPATPDQPNDNRLTDMLTARTHQATAPTIIAIDGPSGSGKSTLARKLADRVGGVPLHTGRHYRAVALMVTMAGVDADNPSEVEALLVHESPRLDDAGNLVVSGRSFSLYELESAVVDGAVSAVSNNDAVRSQLLDLQRAWIVAQVQTGLSVVVEGRDACTRVAPEAYHRFYLNASIEERAARRCNQRDSSSMTRPETRADIIRRDTADQGHGRTTPDTPGITVLDTDHITESEVLERLWQSLASDGPVPTIVTMQGHTPAPPSHNRG